MTEKLLTGYDAPILYCMYLDKPMRDHVLLQAIARVNRPYDDGSGQVKPSGFVLDFFGIFERLEKALAFDSDVVESVIENIDTLKQLFATWMKETAPQYLPYAHPDDDKALEQTVEYLYNDKTRREEFLTFFRRLQNLYELLSPSAFLRPHLEEYEALANLYTFVRRDLDAANPDKELARKTHELLRQHTTSSSLQLPGAIRELGPTELTMLKESNVSDTIKALNLRKLLNIVVEERARYEPHVIPIGERAEEVAKQYEERHIATQQALEDYEKLAEQYIHARPFANGRRASASKSHEYAFRCWKLNGESSRPLVGSLSIPTCSVSPKTWANTLLSTNWFICSLPTMAASSSSFSTRICQIGKHGRRSYRNIFNLGHCAH